MHPYYRLLMGGGRAQVTWGYVEIFAAIGVHWDMRVQGFQILGSLVGDPYHKGDIM